MLLGLQLVDDQLLESLGLCRGGSLPLSDFLGAQRQRFWFMRCECGVGTLMLPNMSFLTGLNATDPKTSSREISNWKRSWRLLAVVPTKKVGQALGSFQELGGVDGILLGLVNCHVDEGPLHGIKEAGHDCGRGLY